jgi:hypothetical protein
MRLLPAVGWMACIWIMSERGGSAIRSPAAAPVRRLPLGPLAVVAHFCVFGLLAVLLDWGLPIRGRNRRALVAFGGAALYGVVDEWHQSRVPGRDPALLDVITDAAGAATAGVVARWLAGVEHAR